MIFGYFTMFSCVLESKTFAELKAICKANKVFPQGPKEDLSQRLIRALSGQIDLVTLVRAASAREYGETELVSSTSPVPSD